ncbi:MAG: NFACT family protein [Clostridia bacterium]|nr:NFACT family protein [Clostridia bacterium]
MPFDGYFLHSVVKEINTASNAHIYKIYQPSREELVLSLRKSGFSEKLFISVKGGMARIHFTNEKSENPDTPPMFCMLLRKHLSNGKLIAAKTFGFERVVNLEFLCSNEMGDKVKLFLVCELMGNTANVILLDSEFRIIDAVKRTGIENTDRIIAPGAVYKLPKREEKLNIVNDDISCVLDRIKDKSGNLTKLLLSSLDGMSPLIAREVLYKAKIDETDTINKDNINNIKKSLLSLRDEVENGTPYIIADKNGEYKDFSFCNISQYGDFYIVKKAESFSSLLDEFYSARQKAAIKKRAGGDLEKLLKNLIARTNKRLLLRKKEQSLAADRQNLLLYGELLKANIHLIKPGAKSVSVINYYSENAEEITIPLDESLSPQSNALKYFKEYKKSKNAEAALEELIEADEREKAYLDSVIFSVQRAENIKEMAEIREELIEGGYIKAQKRVKKPQKIKMNIETHISKEGYKILVGKNNLQNDYITTTLASKNDTWFHVKNIPGSHVVIFNGGKDISEETLTFAATLAAKNSKAASSSNVPVDYTVIKNVKKPQKQKAGMVIYTTNKTIYVTPGEEL